MQEKRLNSSPVSSPKSIFVPKDHAPGIRPQNNIKKSLSIALVTLTLLGAAGFLMTKNSDYQENEAAKIFKQNKAEFVKNAIALSDDGYQSVDQYTHGDHQINGSHQDHEALAKPESNLSGDASVVEREISSVQKVDEALAASEVINSDNTENDERLRAIESESLSLNISEEVESQNQTIRDELKLRKAEEAARYRLAREEAFQKREALRMKDLAEKSKKNAFSKNKNQKMVMKLPYLVSQDPKFETFKGALTKCHIKGHDIHWINEMGWILEHLKIDADLSPNVLAAREIIKKEGSGVVVVVYEKGYEAYDTEGNLIDKGNKE